MESGMVVVISGLLTASAGYVIDARRAKARINQSRNLLKTGVCCDLDSAIDLYDRLLHEWQTTGRVAAVTLQELKQSSSTYHNNPEWLGLFDEFGCSREIFRYHSTLAKLSAGIEQHYADLCEMENSCNIDKEKHEQLKTALSVTMERLTQSRQQAKELLNLLEHDVNARVA